MRTVLRRALGQAVREGIVSRNVASLSVAPRIRAKEGRTLTVDQARQLLEAAARYRFEAAVILALACGMRRGELLGLHWSALDWEAGTLRVMHGVRRVKDRDASSGRRTRLIITELKTEIKAPADAYSRAGGQAPATPGTTDRGADGGRVSMAGLRADLRK
jgi:integrase